MSVCACDDPLTIGRLACRQCGWRKLVPLMQTPCARSAPAPRERTGRSFDLRSKGRRRSRLRKPGHRRALLPGRHRRTRLLQDPGSHIGRRARQTEKVRNGVCEVGGRPRLHPRKSNRRPYFDCGDHVGLSQAGRRAGPAANPRRAVLPLREPKSLFAAEFGGFCRQII